MNNKTQDKEILDASLNKAVFKLPLIGKIGNIECLNALGKKVEFPGSVEERQRFREGIEAALGEYLIDSGNYREILDLLFPRESIIKIEDIITGKVDSAPLFAKVFVGDTQQFNGEATPKTPPSVWSNLMLELGEFKLDEQYEKLLRQIEGFIPYSCCSGEYPDDFTTLFGTFVKSAALLDKIWKRIVGDDVSVIIIDDDKDFDVKWGLDQFVTKISRQNGDAETFKKTKVQQNNILWINPVLENSNSTVHGYDKDSVIKEIKRILYKDFKISQTGLLVFVIDLLYKDQKSINKIEGDNLIRTLREELASGAFEINPLIIGFTGGKSPFVINSAVKAGADIVIMKERGGAVDLPGTHGSSNPGGLFDLLWALSKNINRWRFLKNYKKYIENNPDKYVPVLNKLFFSIEDESPFWKKYLQNWQREIEDIRISSILFNDG